MLWKILITHKGKAKEGMSKKELVKNNNLIAKINFQ